MINAEVSNPVLLPSPGTLQLPGFSYQIACNQMDITVPQATMTTVEMSRVLGKELSDDQEQRVDYMMYIIHLNYTYRDPDVDVAGDYLYPVTMFPALQCSLRAYGLYYGV